MVNEWNALTEEVIHSKTLAGFKNLIFVFVIIGDTYKLYEFLSIV